MATKKKMLMSAAGNAGGGGAGGLNVEDVFSTYLYEGNDTSQTITNGIDLDGEGGLVWIKQRDGSAQRHVLSDTERGTSKTLSSDRTNAEFTDTTRVTSFNSDGFDLGSSSQVNGDPSNYASWTFRKAPKFFTCLTYTGDNTTPRNISHDLGSVPGMIIIKCTESTDDWVVYHRGLDATNPEDYRITLNGTFARESGATQWAGTAPTSTEFTIGNAGNVNANNKEYVVYLFAHNDGDGEFGPDGDQDIIKCGKLDNSGDGFFSHDLGFEPNWIMLKSVDNAGQPDWRIIDRTRATGSSNLSSATYGVNMRVAQGSGTNNTLRANTTEDEGSSSSYIDFGPNGFYGYNNDDSYDFIYIAIRGTTKPPEAGTDVYTAKLGTGSSGTPNLTNIGFNPSLVIRHSTGSSGDYKIGTRQTGGFYYNQSGSSAADEAGSQWDFSGGYYDGTLASDQLCFLFAERHKFMSIIAGNVQPSTTSALTMSHGLGTTPEMIWYQSNINSASDAGWYVYHKDANGGVTPQNYYMSLGSQAAPTARFQVWNFNAPTDTEFTIGTWLSLNQRGVGIAFASVSGVSKISNFTHTVGAATNVNCGFTAGARFVMVKRVDASGDWLIWNSLRGINSGNSPYLQVTSGAAEVTNTDYIDPLSSGFQMTSTFPSGTYIFYAIA